MPRRRDDSGQSAIPDGSPSPWEIRRQLDPMGGEEMEAFEWALRRLAEEHEDLSFSGLCDQGVDEGWFLIRDDGALAVDPDAPVEDVDEEAP